MSLLPLDIDPHLALSLVVIFTTLLGTFGFMRFNEFMKTGASLPSVDICDFDFSLCTVITQVTTFGICCSMQALGF